MELALSERVTAKLKAIASKIGSGHVDVGFLEGQEASIAFWNEFGHGGRFPAPPRPFFRTMVAKESPTWPAKMAAEAKATNYDGPKVLGMMGEDIAGAITQSIFDLTAPPLSPTTLMLRKQFGNSPQNIRARDVVAAQRAVAAGETGATGTQGKPLVWTGTMARSPAYKVES
jgi:hypothetical protein